MERFKLSKKYTLEQFKESKEYRNYGYILDTVLESGKKYSISEVDKKLAVYIKEV